MISYGTVQYSGRQWYITCEPFVKTRLKRLFPRVPQEASKCLRLTASPENTRDLRWFLERYPMDVDQPSKLTALAEQHIHTEKQLALLLDRHRIPKHIQLAEPPREYQSYAAEFLTIKKGYLLADDLGTGKTVSAICCMVRTRALPAVVVCPAHLPRQWEQMINRFAPELRTHIVKKGQVYDMAVQKGRRLRTKGDRLPDVIIISYHKMRGWAEHLANLVKFAVFDECQALRGGSSQIYGACSFVADRVEYKLGLSATPIYNYGHEFHHVIDVLCRDALGSYHEFLREWCVGLGDGKAKISDTEQFGAYLRREGIMLRRTRTDVGRELPELTKVIHDIDSDEVKLDEMKGDAAALALIVLGSTERYRGERMHAAAEFDAMMRQATGLAKAPYVIQFVRLLLDAGEPIVLFGWHRSVYDLWVAELKEHNPVLYTGSESANQKSTSIGDFVEGRSKLLIMSLRSGAGVDGLQGYCNTVVFGELDWSPGVHEQCIGRVHRDG